ncbi:MAG TPA: carbohydrate-binding protein, partial [Verrucomicrobiae bacterium]
GDGQGVGTVANAYCVSNIIRNALYSAIGFSATTNLVLQRNIIESPGLDAITIGPPGIGAGIFGLALLHSNLVSGLIAGHLALTNAAAGFAAVVPVSAANCEIAAGPVTEPCAEGGLNLTGLTNGSYAAYGGLSLTSLNGLVVRAASAGSGGIVEVRLDAPGGTLIGRCPVTGSGGWQSYRNYYTQLTNTTGVHTVFLVFTGGTGNLFNLEYFGIFVVPPVPSHQLLPGNTYALKSGWNGQYVSATNNGGNVLAAQASSPAVPAQFQIYDAGGGNIGLLALVNTNFVCADNNGNNPLIANRTGVGSWETFAEFDAGNGQVALRAMVNGRYVTVSNNAAATLIAKSTAIGVSESLSWQFLTGVPPATPGGLSATAGNGRIQLAWTAVPGAVSYTLRRAASYAGNYGVLASNLTASSFTDSNVVNGVTQYYVVSAVNPAGESTNSLPTTAVPGTLERWRWLVTASSSESGGSPASAVDGNINTRWSTGAQQANGQWYQIDLGQLQTFRGVILDAGSSANDYPRSYQVLVSTNGTIWSGPVASGSGTAGSTTINFTTQSARFLRINQTGSAAGTWWSVHELNILAAPPAGVPGLTGSALPIVAAQLSWNPAVSAAGYNLRRAGTSGGPYTLVAANLGDTNYTDTAVNAGVPDYYVVAATNAYGEGPVTQEMMVRPVAFAPPVLMVQTVNGSRQVSWPADHTGWRLQLQTNDLLNGLGTNWLTVSGSTATNQLALPAAGSPSGFYRLIYP